MYSRRIFSSGVSVTSSLLGTTLVSKVCVFICPLNSYCTGKAILYIITLLPSFNFIDSEVIGNALSPLNKLLALSLGKWISFVRLLPFLVLSVRITFSCFKPPPASNHSTVISYDILSASAAPISICRFHIVPE